MFYKRAEEEKAGRRGQLNLKGDIGMNTHTVSERLPPIHANKPSLSHPHVLYTCSQPHFNFAVVVFISL